MSQGKGSALLLYPTKEFAYRSYFGSIPKMSYASICSHLDHKCIWMILMFRPHLEYAFHTSWKNSACITVYCEMFFYLTPCLCWFSMAAAAGAALGQSLWDFQFLLKEPCAWQSPFFMMPFKCHCLFCLLD